MEGEADTQGNTCRRVSPLPVKWEAQPSAETQQGWMGDEAGR